MGRALGVSEAREERAAKRDDSRAEGSGAVDDVGAAGDALCGFGANGESCLHILARLGRTAALRQLIAHAGAKTAATIVDARKDGSARGGGGPERRRPPPHRRLRRLRRRAVRVLIEAGFDASTADSSGQTALSLAAAAGSREACVALLAAGAPASGIVGSRAPKPLELAVTRGLWT